jgi:excisionase family DNA binding protein
MDKSLLRVDEVAELLQVSRWTVYRWVEEGKLRGTKLGKSSLRIFQSSVAGLIEDNRIEQEGLVSDASGQHIH